MPAFRQIAWLKSEVRALIAHVKSGLSCGNPHRFDGGDTEETIYLLFFAWYRHDY